MAHGHRRSALSDESMSSLPDFGYADTEAQAAEERDEIDFLIDGYGNAIWMDERPRRIKVPEQAEPVLERPIGYVEFARTEEPDPRWMVDGKFEPDANDVTPRTLQRSTGGETYTTSDGQVRKRGGGGGGDSAGKAKKSGGGGGATASERPSGRDPAMKDLEEIAVYGLTDAEVEFFHDRPGLAREVLEAAAIRINCGEESVWMDAFTAPAVRSKTVKGDFCVAGLEPLHVYLLRAYPGTARRALSIYAHDHQADEVPCAELTELAA